jgi:hypothetical protein
MANRCKADRDDERRAECCRIPFSPYYPWLLPIVLVAAPVLAGILWLTGDRVAKSFHYDDRPPCRPKLRVALIIGVGVILLTASVLVVWNPHLTRFGFVAPAANVILLMCVFYFSGRVRSLRMMINQPRRVDGTIIGVGGIVLLATGIVLWVSATYLAFRMSQIHALYPDAEAQRLGGMTAAALLSIICCGVGAQLRRTWRRLQAHGRS